MLLAFAAAPGGALHSQQHLRVPAINGDSLDADLYGSGGRAVALAIFATGEGERLRGTILDVLPNREAIGDLDRPHS